MSQANAELVTHGIEAYVARDWERWVAGLDPEIEWIETRGLGPDAAVYRGIDEVRGAVESWLAMWADYGFEVHDCIEVGDQVVVLARERGRGRSTGVRVDRELGQIHELRHGKLIRTRLYGSWVEALDAAGLSE